MELPNSTSDCVYFTRRIIEDGKAIAWVLKEDCEKCGKAKMGKPIEKGKVKIRAKEYVCPSCGHTEEKTAHEEKLTCNIQYTCPHCKHTGEVSVPFKRKSFNGAKAVVFLCEKCNQKIGITKKMK